MILPVVLCFVMLRGATKILERLSSSMMNDCRVHRVRRRTIGHGSDSALPCIGPKISRLYWLGSTRIVLHRPHRQASGCVWDTRLLNSRVGESEILEKSLFLLIVSINAWCWDARNVDCRLTIEPEIGNVAIKPRSSTGSYIPRSPDELLVCCCVHSNLRIASTQTTLNGNTTCL